MWSPYRCLVTSVQSLERLEFGHIWRQIDIETANKFSLLSAQEFTDLLFIHSLIQSDNYCNLILGKRICHIIYWGVNSLYWMIWENFIAPSLLVLVHWFILRWFPCYCKFALRSHITRLHFLTSGWRTKWHSRELFLTTLGFCRPWSSIFFMDTFLWSIYSPQSLLKNCI